MFGLLYEFGMMAASTIDGINGIFDNSKRIHEALNRQNNGENFAGVYYDRHGALRDLKTGEIASIKSDINDICDDKYLYVGTSSIKTRNISEEKRRHIFEEGKKGNWLGRTTDIYDKRKWATDGKNKYITIIHGAFYADLKNNALYVCREFKLSFDKDTKTFIKWNSKYGFKPITCSFYMDIHTGLLVRKSDTQYEYEKKYPNNVMTESDAQIFIKQFNNAQKNGGWYHGDSRRNGNKEILRKQDYYCDELDCIDHVYNLVEMRKQIKSENNYINNELDKEVRKL